MHESPDASGSGNSLTPLSRIYLAHFTAFSSLVAVLLPLLLHAALGAGEPGHGNDADQ
jgi:hypothetical protein